MNRSGSSSRRLRWILILGALVVLGTLGSWQLWKPGTDFQDGRHDRGRNALWLAHGWLGADSWFLRYNKTNEFGKYRDASSVQALADRVRRHRIVTVYPHLCPTDPTGQIPEVDKNQVERFLDALTGVQVIPWIGGPNGTAVDLTSLKWRSNFCASAQQLLNAHPRLAGVQLNIEPLPDGDPNFLVLLDELRPALPSGKVLSIAAYPPPTRWHPYPEVHWSEPYIREVAKRVDELAYMLYDAAQHEPKMYQQLMASWTREVLTWSEGCSVLLGVPTYNDAGVGYHDPAAENLTNALAGIHQGLSSLKNAGGSNYLGVAIYCDWETEASEWEYFRRHFLKP